MKPFSISSSLSSLTLLPCISANTLGDGEYSFEVYRRDAQATPDRTTLQVDSWHTTVEIGTPPQSFSMLIDSGAGAMAIQSVFMPPDQASGAPQYDPRKSSTSKNLTYTYENCYASSHCGNGFVFQDNVKVGGLSLTMDFEIATGNNGKGSNSSDASGDFGIAFAKNGMKIEKAGVASYIPTWFQNIQSQLADKVLTMNYGTDSGTYDVGFIDQSKYTGDIGYTPMQGDYYWGINFTGYAVGKQTFVSKTWTAIVDSGTSITSLPSDVVAAYFAGVSGSSFNKDNNMYNYPCSTSLPDFTFGLGNYRGTINGSLIEDATPNGSRCTAKLVAKDDGLVFGQNFIRGQFVVLDWGNRRVGMANKVGQNQLSSGNGTNLTSPTDDAQSTAIKTGAKSSFGLLALAFAMAFVQG